MDSGKHILSFSESWVHKPLPNNLFHLRYDFTLLRNDRKRNDYNNPTSHPTNGGGGGVSACISKTHLITLKPHIPFLIGLLKI